MGTRPGGVICHVAWPSKGGRSFTQLDERGTPAEAASSIAQNAGDTISLVLTPPVSDLRLLQAQAQQAIEESQDQSDLAVESMQSALQKARAASAKSFLLKKNQHQGGDDLIKQLNARIPHGGRMA